MHYASVPVHHCCESLTTSHNHGVYRTECRSAGRQFAWNIVANSYDLPRLGVFAYVSVTKIKRASDVTSRPFCVVAFWQSWQTTSGRVWFIFSAPPLSDDSAAPFCVGLDSNDMMPPMQSAYRRFHSTETAVTKVYNDLLLAADVGQVSALCLLDLTAAFDTVDHQLLLHRLERQYGLRGVALAWFSSYLTRQILSGLVQW